MGTREQQKEVRGKGYLGATQGWGAALVGEGRAARVQRMEERGATQGAAQG